ncbi:MAG: hypothetical protein V3V13_05590 [Paracoccaceae bacterium]
MNKITIIAIGTLLLSACDGTLDYNADNLVRIEHDQHVYRVPIQYVMENGNAQAESLKEKQLAKYCLNGYRELDRTSPEIYDTIQGGFYGPTAYVPTSTYARYYITVKCAE